MKIISVDEFDISDSIVAENVCKMYAEIIVELLNNNVKGYGLKCYRFVDDNYELRKWDEEKLDQMFSDTSLKNKGVLSSDA